jgi:hypothetical protein
VRRHADAGFKRAAKLAGRQLGLPRQLEQSDARFQMGFDIL